MIQCLPGQTLYRECVTKYEKLSKLTENENMTESIKTESSQEELASSWTIQQFI